MDNQKLGKRGVLCVKSYIEHMHAQCSWVMNVLIEYSDFYLFGPSFAFHHGMRVHRGNCLEHLTVMGYLKRGDDLRDSSD